MTLADYFLLYLFALALTALIDLTWLGIIFKNFYNKELKKLLRAKTNWAPAIIFYLVYVFGLLYLVIGPAIDNDSLLVAMASGAVFGLVAYSTYNLTNLATIKNWSKKVVIVDILWGTFLTFVVSTISYNLYIGFLAG